MTYNILARKWSLILYIDPIAEAIGNNSFHPAITKPTRIPEFSATIIDNIYCNATSNSLAGIV